MGLNLQKKEKKIYSYYHKCKKDPTDVYDREVFNDEECLTAQFLEQVLNTMSDKLNIGSNFEIKDIRLFDKYQGPYAVVNIFGKSFKIWMLNEHGYDELYIENFPINNMSEDDNPGYRASPEKIIDMIIDLDQKKMNEGINLPKREQCPVCGSYNTRNDYDFIYMKDCDNCGSEWTNDGTITFNAREFQKDSPFYDVDKGDVNEGLNLQKKPKLPDISSIKMNDGRRRFKSEVIDLLSAATEFDESELNEMSLEELADLWDNMEMNNIVDNLEENKKNMKEQKLETGKLKLTEVLTPADIAQIKVIAKAEAKDLDKTVKSDLEKNIADVKKQQQATDKSLETHTKNKTDHLGEKDVLKIAKDEDETVKSDLEKKIDDKVNKAMTGKDLERKVRDMFVDAMTDYHKTLWVKRGFWSGSVKK